MAASATATVLDAEISSGHGAKYGGIGGGNGAKDGSVNGAKYDDVNGAKYGGVGGAKCW